MNSSNWYETLPAATRQMLHRHLESSGKASVTFSAPIPMTLCDDASLPHAHAIAAAPPTFHDAPSAWPASRVVRLVKTTETYGRLEQGRLVPCESVPNFDVDALGDVCFTCETAGGHTFKRRFSQVEAVFALPRKGGGDHVFPFRPYIGFGETCSNFHGRHTGYRLKNTVMDSVLCDDRRYRVSHIFFLLTTEPVFL